MSSLLIWRQDKDNGCFKSRREMSPSHVSSTFLPPVLFQIVRLGFQLGFALWGLFLCGSFLYAGKRVLGILGYSAGADGTGVSGVNEKGNKHSQENRGN